MNRTAKRKIARAVVIIRADQTEPKEKDRERDPIYGNSLPATWSWLNANRDGETDEGRPWIDFRISSIRDKWDAATVEQRAELDAPAPEAPVLLPAHLDCWVQTNPIPVPDPDPAIYLHGPSRGSPEVQVVFRSDLGRDEKQWAEVVALCPPSSSEAVAVRLSVFKGWLGGQFITDTSGDVEGEPDEPNEETLSGQRRVLRWQGPTNSRPISDPGNVYPNLVYVVPISTPDEISDARALGDFPSEPDDLCENAFQRSRDRALLRLTASTLTDDAEDFDDRLSEEIRSRVDDTSPDWLRRAVECLAKPRNRVVERHPSGGWVAIGRRRLGQFDPEFLEDEESSYSPAGDPIELDDHSLGVASYAERFAVACGLESDVFALAGRCHDLGKLDPRFQRLLKGFPGGPPLAKSGRFRPRESTVCQYPLGGRHELLSAAMVATKTDDDLLLHLIATHHGSARPFAGFVAENDNAQSPFSAKLFDLMFDLQSSAQQTAPWNAELPERFWRVVRRVRLVGRCVSRGYLSPCRSRPKP